MKVIYSDIKSVWANSEKKQANRGSWGHKFFEPSGIFSFSTSPLEIPDKARLHPEKMHK